MSINHQLRFIKGKALLKKDVQNWSEAKLLSALQFADFFTNKNNDPHTFDVVQIKIAAAEERAKDDAHWAEFMARLSARDQTTKQFSYKLMAFVRIFVGWIRTNPYALTPQMRAIMESNQRLKWGIDTFKEKKTEIGATVVEMDNREETNPGLANVTPGSTSLATPEVQYAQALSNMASILNRLTSGIKNNEISSLDAKEKIKLAATLGPVLAKAIGQHRPNVKIFKQLVINKAGKEELEKAFLDYTESQSDE